MRFEQTQYGFNWGSAEVERMMSDEDKEWVYLGVRSPKQVIYVYVTRTGKIRVYKAKLKGRMVGKQVELK